MNRILKVTSLFALAWSLSLLGAPAQTNTPTSHTNLLMSVSVSLTAYVQQYNVVGTNRIAQTVQAEKVASKDFIAALIEGASTTNNDLTGAKLYFRVQDVGTTNEAYNFILKKGDVEQSLDAGSTHFYLTSSSADIFTKRTAGSSTNVLEYIIADYTFSTPKGFGTVSGFTKIKSSSVSMGRTVVTLEPKFAAINSSVAVGGAVDGREAIYKGTINIGGRKVEVIQSP